MRTERVDPRLLVLVGLAVAGLIVVAVVGWLT